MDKKVNKPRSLAEIQADMEQAARRGDDAVILLGVVAAAALAWIATPGQRTAIVESWRQAALQQRLCQAYVAVAPDKSYADFPVCLPSVPGRAADGR